MAKMALNSSTGAILKTLISQRRLRFQLDIADLMRRDLDDSYLIAVAKSNSHPVRRAAALRVLIGRQRVGLGLTYLPLRRLTRTHFGI